MFTTRPELRGTFGAVSSTHWLASAAGMSILERGGNAFDAAVTAGFVLQVVEPHLNGPGGEVPILLWSADRRRPEAICGQGVLPAAATIEHFRALGLGLVPGTGLLPACVPGSFGAWMKLLLEFGTMRIEDVLAPAIGYAANGYPAVARIPAAIETVRELFRRNGRHRRRSICRTARCRKRDSSSATPASPRPMPALSRPPNPPAPIARRRSRRRGAPGTRDSSPRRSIASTARKR